jgi:molybdopterin-containing oxidoreductase family iron-sulfur binding subunit
MAPPGGQSLIALGLLKILLEKNHAPALDRAEASMLRTAVADFSTGVVEKLTGVREEMLHKLAASFMKAERPLVLAEGMGYQDVFALNTARAANLLCRLVLGSRKTIDFSVPSALSHTARAGDMKDLTDKIGSRAIDVVFILRTNPIFSLPPQWRLAEALKSARLVVSFSSFPDESSQQAHLILPTHTFLESWGDYEPRAGIRGLMQPVTGFLFNTRSFGDILLSLGRNLRGTDAFPEKDFYEVVRNSWFSAGRKDPTQADDDASWERALQEGGFWPVPEKSRANPVKRPSLTGLSFTLPSGTLFGASERNSFSFVSYPTIQFFDGRMSNRPFLQELPDPLTAVTWGGWIEINPRTAERLGIRKGDILSLHTEFGAVQAPAYPYPGISPGAVAMPIGHGHSDFGRHARNDVANPGLVSGSALDKAGGICLALTDVSLSRTGTSTVLAHTDGSYLQHGRRIARAVAWHEFVDTAANPPQVILPLAKGFSRERDIYAPHTHDSYRWSMVVDLDRCIGCGACVVACYAENNVAVVGKKDVLKGREMAWLHIQRYFDEANPLVQFFPMLCQHCDEAPCEAVCPVFAPHHSREGLNNQVYNRCIGTRFCNQNCPYKVRRFNWFTWTYDPSLEWQLNPDVTVRTKGVMEKCSFCIQRIVEAKIKARGENRLVRDGEFAPACAQTCPADALIFGNLKDPESRVAKLVQSSRAYQALGDLNTKPGVIYLKKIAPRPI